MADSRLHSTPVGSVILENKGQIGEKTRKVVDNVMWSTLALAIAFGILLHLYQHRECCNGFLLSRKEGAEEVSVWGDWFGGFFNPMEIPSSHQEISLSGGCKCSSAPSEVALAILYSLLQACSSWRGGRQPLLHLSLHQTVRSWISGKTTPKEWWGIGTGRWWWWCWRSVLIWYLRTWFSGQYWW